MMTTDGQDADSACIGYGYGSLLAKNQIGLADFEIRRAGAGEAAV